MPALVKKTFEKRLSSLEKRIPYLEKQVALQDEVTIEKEHQLA